jgi:hypothetical protein
MKITRSVILIAAVFIAVQTSMNCSKDTAGRDSSVSAKENTAVDSKFNETASIFAGNGVKEGSALYKFCQSKFYQSYAKEINSGWKKFQQPNIEEIQKWWSAHKPAHKAAAVMYPFSGPDIMNALTFYPDAEKIIMFGLEPPGKVPDPHSMTEKDLLSGLNSLRRSLNSIFHVNFFRTESMAVEIENTSFNSTGGLIMFFLSLNGYTVTGVRTIAVDADAKVVDATKKDEAINWQNPPRSRIPGIEIKFRKGAGSERVIRYYMLNVIDQALANSSPNFIPYLKKEGPYSTVLKSASYLMHNDKVKFTKIREAVLSLSDYIIQDDSGVPLRYFPADTWKLKFHGYYDRPISLFAHRTQKDLFEAMKKNTTGTLPFSYGYDYQKGKSNLMSAERIKK